MVRFYIGKDMASVVFRGALVEGVLVEFVVVRLLWFVGHGGED